MKVFRKLAKNILFKIVLGIVALSFILFGVAEFISGMPNSWVIKVGDEKIGLKAFQQALDLDRRIIRSAKGSSPEIEQYLASNRFSQDVSNRMARRLFIEKISHEIGTSGSKKLILKTVAQDQNFQNNDGKFDHNKFKTFLANKGLDEDRYIKEVSNEISAEMIIGTIGLVSPVNFKNAVELETFNRETRVADTLYLSKNIVKDFTPPSPEEIQKHYNDNKSKFKTSEYRNVSYIVVDSKSFEKKISVSEDEILKYYQDNLATIYTTPESKNYLHLSFEEEKSAQEFEKKLQSFNDSIELKNNFIKFASSDRQKKLEEITLNNITKNSLPEPISKAIENLQINQLSKIVKSEIGYHLFLPISINPQKQLTLLEAKNRIFDKIFTEKKSKIIQETIASINDSLMVAKSLDDIALKHEVKINNLPFAISASGLDPKNSEIIEIKKLTDFSKNAFSSKPNQPTKLFNSSDPGVFYALEVKNIVPSYQPELSEIKNQIIQELTDKIKTESLVKLSQKIHQEINANPSQAFIIASKYGAKFERNKTFPRTLYLDLGNNKMPYKNQFLTDLFNTSVGKVTPLADNGQNEFMIGIVRDIKKAELSSEDIVNTKNKAVEIFASDIMMEYNDYLQKKYPVEVNKKFFTQNS